MCGIIGSSHFASVTVTPTTCNGVVTNSQGAAASVLAPRSILAKVSMKIRL